MNLRNKKGYVITDVSVAIIILLVLLPVIMGIIYGTEASKTAAETKTEALNIAINTVEAAKGIDIASVTSGEVLSKLSELECYHNNGNSISNNGSEAVINTKKASFKVSVNVTDYSSTNAQATENIVKTVTAIVYYKERGEVKNIQLSTAVK